MMEALLAANLAIMAIVGSLALYAAAMWLVTEWLWRRMGTDARHVFVVEWRRQRRKARPGPRVGQGRVKPPWDG